MSLLTMPEELLLSVMDFVPDRDIINFSQTSRRLHRISYSRAEAYRVLQRRYRTYTVRPGFEIGRLVQACTEDEDAVAIHVRHLKFPKPDSDIDMSAATGDIKDEEGCAYMRPLTNDEGNSIIERLWYSGYWYRLSRQFRKKMTCLVTRYPLDQGFAATLLILAFPNLESLELDGVQWDTRYLHELLPELVVDDSSEKCCCQSSLGSLLGNLSRLSFRGDNNVSDRIVSGFMALPSMTKIDLASVRFSENLGGWHNGKISANLSSISIINSDVSTKAFSNMLSSVASNKLKSFTYAASGDLCDPNPILRLLHKYARGSLQQLDICGRSTSRVLAIRDYRTLGEFKELKNLGLSHRIVMRPNEQKTFRRIVPSQIQTLSLYVDLDEFTTSASMLGKLEVLYQAAKTHSSEVTMLEKVRLRLFSGRGEKLQDGILAAKFRISAKFMELMNVVLEV